MAVTRIYADALADDEKPNGYDALECDDAPFSMVPGVEEGVWWLATSNSAPLGGSCPTEDDARVVLQALEDTYKALVALGHIGTNW